VPATTATTSARPKITHRRSARAGHTRASANCEEDRGVAAETANYTKVPRGSFRNRQTVQIRQVSVAWPPAAVYAETLDR
jgi:hypothetical protein